MGKYNRVAPASPALLAALAAEDAAYAAIYVVEDARRASERRGNDLRTFRNREVERNVLSLEYIDHGFGVGGGGYLARISAADAATDAARDGVEAACVVWRAARAARELAE